MVLRFPIIINLSNIKNKYLLKTKILAPLIVFWKTPLPLKKSWGQYRRLSKSAGVPVRDIISAGPRKVWMPVESEAWMHPPNPTFWRDSSVWEYSLPELLQGWFLCSWYMLRTYIWLWAFSLYFHSFELKYSSNPLLGSCRILLKISHFFLSRDLAP